MIFTDPKDFSECCDGLGELPHLHAEDCPLRESEAALFREDPDERASFDRNPFRDGLQAVIVMLDTMGRMNPTQRASFPQQCYIAANECIKAEATIDRLTKELAEALAALEKIK